MKLNLGSGLKQKPTAEGWLNCDRMALPGVDHRIDLFTFPWNFPDDSCDEFFISHLIEHIPHEARVADRQLTDAERLRWLRLKDLDAFFCFFAEIWRIGVNGAKLEIVCPYGQTNAAMQDPTHTRFIVPATFAYLTEEMHQNKDFNYHLHYLFTIDDLKFDMQEGMKEADFQGLLGHVWNMTNTMYVKASVVK
jgi:hypothetical protein